MTREDHVRLAPLHAAVRGWEASPDKRPYLTKGEIELRKLPDRLKNAAEAILAPIRRSSRPR